ncbi:MAG: hypothetical protein WAZ12_03135 [Candidatus Absconditicoccaceae bacterium]
MKKKTSPEVHQMRRSSAKFQRGDTAKQRLVKVLEAKDKIYSFAELEQKSIVSFEELKATLKDYAEGGRAISSRVVISIIDRMKINENDKWDLIEIAKKGMKVHQKMEEPIEEEKYQKVYKHLLNSMNSGGGDDGDDEEEEDSAI